MQFISTTGKSAPVSFREAVLSNLAPDGGLYMPAELPLVGSSFLDRFRSLSFQEISFEVARVFVEDEITAKDLRNIVDAAFNFDVLLIQFSDSVSGLELFHGPTLAFKDFGARFMARVMSHFHQEKRDRLILTATSGDTGAAVAHAFCRMPGFRVVILYPSGQTSKTQEQQFATLDENITALEVQGSFDDCQLLVKQAFADAELNRVRSMSSANSINIARLIAQIFYYWEACRLHPSDTVQCCSVPSGNYGNLTAGLIAKKMGAPIRHFVAASNANDVVPQYLKTGKFATRASIRTISNSMDVGNPGNFVRILFLYQSNYEAIVREVSGFSFPDEQTRAAIREVYDRSATIIDPHSAVAYLGLKKSGRSGIFLETAHPAKFPEVIEDVLGFAPPVPRRLQEYLPRRKQSIPMDADFRVLKQLLLSM